MAFLGAESSPCVTNEKRLAALCRMTRGTFLVLALKVPHFRSCQSWGNLEWLATLV